jgi:predicted metalloprotease with PDZ domain
LKPSNPPTAAPLRGSHRGEIARPLPQPLPQAAPIIEPRDVDYPGVIRLHVTATDVERRIFDVKQAIPVAAGPLTLLYPEWLPGYHSPRAPIELLAGLEIRAGGETLQWRRHPTVVHAFHLEVPDGCPEIEATFQFLSPTAKDQGRVVVSPDLLNLEWNMVVLYPAGHFARRIMVAPKLTLPQDWQFACSLTVERQEDSTTSFEPVALDELVDSPLMAGRYFRRIVLDGAGEVALNLVADRSDLLDATEEQIAPHRELVQQADRLFGARHFDRFEFLVALSDEIGTIAVEHHRSCEIVKAPDYFTGWEGSVTGRDSFPHEYVHSWNGKYRRGADSWTPCFHQPIRNSLMWVYEGQTNYWDRVLCARSGLWTLEQALGALADMAATQDVQAGEHWRSLSDTTKDPIIVSRNPIPWPSWQRSEDYYFEGALLWLDVDTRIRELSGDTRSLDDFARAFFGGEDRVWITSTYTFEDVVEALDAIAPFDWARFFDRKLNEATDDAPLDGLERGGYRLVYRDTPSEYHASKEACTGNTNLLYSIGLMVASGGEVSQVLWDSPAFQAGITSGATLLAVNGRTFSPDELKRAVAAAGDGDPITLVLQVAKRHKEVRIDCPAGHRYPHLERIEQARSRLDEILAPKAA